MKGRLLVMLRKYNNELFEILINAINEEDHRRISETIISLQNGLKFSAYDDDDYEDKEEDS